MTLRFLSVEAIESLHTQTIERFGGSHGLRDRGLLESAVARAENLAYYNAEASVGELAATLGWGLTCTETEVTAMVLRVAATEMDEAEWTAWVARNVAPIRR